MGEERTYRRPQASVLEKRLQEPRRFLQVVAGPRQAGKTTLVRQVLERRGAARAYASADEPALKGREWIVQQWDAARLKAATGGRRGAVLALDEVQKVPGWSEVVKRLWDEDTARGRPLKAILLGSAPLLLQRGLTESLAGRFEVIHLPHWTLAEMRKAFGWDLDTFLALGGYPGSAPLAGDFSRWRRYILDSLVETTLSRDVLLLSRVDKPALLRRLFDLACAYSGQVLSYQKMLGQLQDAGNTTTLAHYLDLLKGAGMVMGLQKYAGDKARQRGSSPKLQVLNNALMAACTGQPPEALARDGEWRGRLVESAVGAHLAAGALAGDFELFYWREKNREVDFVLRSGKRVVALEVKSGRKREALPGIEAFASVFNPRRSFLVGGDGVPIDEFLLAPPSRWIEDL